MLRRRRIAATHEAAKNLPRFIARRDGRPRRAMPTKRLNDFVPAAPGHTAGENRRKVDEQTQIHETGASPEAGGYCSGRPPMILIVSSWSPPSCARGAIFGWT